MFKPINGMPPGTVGFEAVGEIDDDDFEDVVAPVLRRQLASGHKLRLLYLLGPQLREYDGDAAQEQLKFAARHITAYERVCVVSDESWLGPAHSLDTGPRHHERISGRRNRRREAVGGRRAGSRWRADAGLAAVRPSSVGDE